MSERAKDKLFSFGFFAVLLAINVRICFMEPHNSYFEISALLNGIVFGWIAARATGEA